MKWLIGALVLFGIMPAMAGTVGNGGDVVICKVGQQTTYTILDQYESEYARDIYYEFPEAQTWQEIVKYVIDVRLAKYSSARAAQYNEWLSAFDSDMRFTREREVLSEILDSYEIGIEEHCERKQIAIQMDLIFGNKFRYVIDAPLWNKLDIQQKAILVLHEIILREARADGQTNSLATRYFTSYLLAKIQHETSIADVFKEIASVFSNASLNAELLALPMGSDIVQDYALYMLDVSGSNSIGGSDPDKQKRKDIFSSIHRRYLDKDFSQKLATWDGSTNERTNWKSNKSEFVDIYSSVLQGPDNGGSNLDAVGRFIELQAHELFYRNDANEFKRLSVIIMIDGPDNMGLNRFRSLEDIASVYPLRIHFAYYGDDTSYVKELRVMAATLNGKVFTGSEIYNVEF